MYDSCNQEVEFLWFYGLMVFLRFLINMSVIKRKSQRICPTASAHMTNLLVSQHKNTEPSAMNDDDK